jgi:hypothetical protein
VTSEDTDVGLAGAGGSFPSFPTSRETTITGRSCFPVGSSD